MTKRPAGTSGRDECFGRLGGAGCDGGGLGRGLGRNAASELGTSNGLLSTAGRSEGFRSGA